LADVYHFRAINKDTKIYGLVTNPLSGDASPSVDNLLSANASAQVLGYIRFYNTVFTLEEINAVYVPFPVTSIADFMDLANEMDVSGLSISGSHKDDVVPFLYEQSSQVETGGSCNTMSKNGVNWTGCDTDSLGFLDSLLEFAGRKNFKRQKISLIGAGSMAKVIAHELYRLGASVLILNRSILKARELAARYKFAWGTLDNRGIDMIKKYRDVIIQATPAGSGGNDDPIEMYTFCGREAVMDLVCKPERSRLLLRAAAAGCRIIDGYDIFTRQLRHQYTQFMGRDFPPQLMSRVQFNRN